MKTKIFILSVCAFILGGCATGGNTLQTDASLPEAFISQGDVKLKVGISEFRYTSFIEECAKELAQSIDQSSRVLNEKCSVLWATKLSKFTSDLLDLKKDSVLIESAVNFVNVCAQSRRLALESEASVLKICLGIWSETVIEVLKKDKDLLRDFLQPSSYETFTT